MGASLESRAALEPASLVLDSRRRNRIAAYPGVFRHETHFAAGLAVNLSLGTESPRPLDWRRDSVDAAPSPLGYRPSYPKS